MEVKILKNSCYSIERRLCLRLFLFLALYAIIGFAVLLLSNYVLEVFPSSVCIRDSLLSRGLVYFYKRQIFALL